MRSVVERCKRTMLACGAGVLGCACVEELNRAKSCEENFGSYTPQKAALLRDLGMGTYIDAGEGKRISQGDMFFLEKPRTRTNQWTRTGRGRRRRRHSVAGVSRFSVVVVLAFARRRRRRAASVYASPTRPSSSASRNTKVVAVAFLVVRAYVLLLCAPLVVVVVVVVVKSFLAFLLFF